MRYRAIHAIVLSVTLVFMLFAPSVRTSDAATTKLSSSSFSIRVGKSKTLKMKNTSRKVTWSIKSGKSYIKLTNKKKKQVKVVGKKAGSAVVKAVIKYSSKKKKTYTCKVKVKKEQWECPICGFLNTANFCSNCGYNHFSSPEPEQSEEPTATPTPTPTPSPTPTIEQEVLSDKHIVMVLNRKFYFNVQLYANASANDFYDRISKAEEKTLQYYMAPIGDNERYTYLESPISVPAAAVSKSKQVVTGELYLYGESVVKLAQSSHETSAFPTRIGIICQDVETLERALNSVINGRTETVFKLYQ